MCFKLQTGALLPVIIIHCMSKHIILASILVALVAVLVVLPEALAYHEDPEIDMQYTVNPTIGESVTIDCTKDTSTELDVLMTIIRYHDKVVLDSIADSGEVVSYTLTPQDSSMIQIFCEYIDDKEDKVGYAVMRTFTPK